MELKLTFSLLVSFISFKAFNAISDYLPRVQLCSKLKLENQRVSNELQDVKVTCLCLLVYDYLSRHFFSTICFVPQCLSYLKQQYLLLLYLGKLSVASK
ncbi:hypothetical protein M758_2G170800 [Ceratodon purpureus]|nr:hypothetical protein M758_2G170800 [Ceratodon purpureus]